MSIENINNGKGVTKMSLNDRFTIMQAIGPKLPTRRPINRSAIRGIKPTTTKTTIANRKFLQRLETKHNNKRTITKLQRRNLMTNTSTSMRQRLRRNLKGFTKRAANGIRLTPGGKLIRSNSLTNIATMKADLVRPRLRRSNSTSNLAARLGNKSMNSTSGLQTRRRINRNNNMRRSTSKANLKRSNSQTNLMQPGISRINNIRLNMKSNNIRNNRNMPLRRNNSIKNRLGIRKIPNKGNNNRVRNRQNLIVGKNGRIYKRKNSMPAAAIRSRPSRPRERGGVNAKRFNNSVNARSVSRNSRRINPGTSARFNQRNSRGRKPVTQMKIGTGTGTGTGTGIRRGQEGKNQNIKREDLDMELDQYMANSTSNY